MRIIVGWIITVVNTRRLELTYYFAAKTAEANKNRKNSNTITQHNNKSFMSHIVARIGGVKKLIQEDYPSDRQGTRARQVTQEGSPDFDITIV